MKRLPFLLAATLCTPFCIPLGAASPARSQNQIIAPEGWKTATKAGDARTFTPPDLQTGEVYSVTVYDSASLGGKTPEEYLRKFAGPVGTGAGKLRAPLQIKAENANLISGIGAYNGPNGADLGVVFFGVSLDGTNIHVERVLFSSDSLFLNRYKAERDAILESLAQRARDGAGERAVNVPQKALGNLTPGGAIVPGVYAGDTLRGAKLRYRLHLHLYASGEYRLTDDLDRDFKKHLTGAPQAGKIAYDRRSGKLEVNSDFDLRNELFADKTTSSYCFYGRDPSGKPAIYSVHFNPLSEADATLLLYVGPPNKRLSASQESLKNAAQDERESAEKARLAAIEERKTRFPWTTPPGRGVQNAQIERVLIDYKGETSASPLYLVLRDGTIYQGLSVAPDELDIARSKQHEPAKWGRWRKTPTGYSASWQGGRFEAVSGLKALPASAPMKLAGHWFVGTSVGGFFSMRGVTFSKAGRFITGSRSGASFNMGDSHINVESDGNGTAVSGTDGSSVIGSEGRRKNPRGASEGAYSLGGYSLTLRYDNGRVERQPFFFFDAKHESLWFDNSMMVFDNSR